MILPAFVAWLLDLPMTSIHYEGVLIAERCVKDTPICLPCRLRLQVNHVHPGVPMDTMLVCNTLTCISLCTKDAFYGDLESTEIPKLSVTHAPSTCQDLSVDQQHKYRMQAMEKRRGK